MNAFFFAIMPNQFDNCDKAGLRAKEIYEMSKRCLMAHSIRAVEQYLLEKFDFNTQIILAVEDWMRSDLGRVSFCSVAVSSGGVTYIYVQNDLDFNHQRFCIAHELYHIIWSVGSTEVTNHVRDRKAEELSDCFANDLCLDHFKFYSDLTNVAKLKSIGDRRYRSI